MNIVTPISNKGSVNVAGDFLSEVQTGIVEVSSPTMHGCKSMVLFGCCVDENMHTSYPKPTHLLESIVDDSERTRKGLDAVIHFNRTRLMIEEKNTCYFEGDFVVNHMRLISMLDLIQDELLFKTLLEIGSITIQMKYVHRDYKDARKSEEELGHSNRYSYRVSTRAKNMREEANDIMIQFAATLYLIALHLLKMARLYEDEDLMIHVMERRDHHRLTFLANPWRNKQNEYCNPGTRATFECLGKIESELVTPVIDMLDSLKEDLKFIMHSVHYYAGKADSDNFRQYCQKMNDKRSISRTILIDASVLLEISAMYMLYMAKGMNVSSHNVSLLDGGNQLLRGQETFECLMCGNPRTDDKSMCTGINE